MTIHRQTISTDPKAVGTRKEAALRSPRIAAFDAAEFDELSEMIGQIGAVEMIGIFESETRLRLRRLAAGTQDSATLVREMHTLKGAAGTVGAPRLTALGRTFEHAAQKGISPAPRDLAAIEDALEAFLREARARSQSRAATACVRDYIREATAPA